jgi:hypothetical protein
MRVGAAVTLLAPNVLLQVARRQFLGLEVDVANQTAIIAGGSRRGWRNEESRHGDVCGNVR